MSCADGDPCTADSCSAMAGCEHTPVSCDDGNACTVDSCNPTSGCVYEPMICDDDDACTNDSCDSAVGCTYTEVVCDDSNPCTRNLCDPDTGCNFSTNVCPDCSGAYASDSQIWPPNHRLVPIYVLGVTDPQGDDPTIRIDNITQDEVTNGLGDGDTCPDSTGIGTPVAQIRAERAGTPHAPGDGRVYHVSFTATDTDGYSCTGRVLACVPHDMGGRAQCVDEGELHDSQICE
jgi:hypothetical protein